SLFFLLLRRPPPSSTLFPYTTLFRSDRSAPSRRRDLPARDRPLALTVRAPRPSGRRGSAAVVLGRITRLVSEGDPRVLQIAIARSEEHTSELQSLTNLVCRLLPDKKNYTIGEFTNKDYPGLVPDGTSVDTLAVPAVLAVFNWPQGHDRYRHVARMVEAMVTN